MAKPTFQFNQEEIIHEATLFITGYLIILLVYQAAFYHTPLSTTLRIITSFFLVFVIPGYLVMLFFKNHLDALERFIIGILVGILLIPFFSYYLGLIGLHIKYHHLVIPPLLVIILSISYYFYLQKNITP